MISNTVRFWSYLIFLIPSIICSLFALYHLLFDRTLRQALNNHIFVLILIVGLICEVTDYPWLLYYYRHDGIWDRSLIFCQIWGFIDWGLYIAQTILFAWATIERHILIFHDGWVSTKKKRIFIHYLPPIVLLLYCLIIYTVVYFFPSCQNSLDFFYVTCVDACLFDAGFFSVFDTIVHEVSPVFVIIIFSISLLLRVLWKKYRTRQPIQWRKQRKMTIQLLSISFLYLLLLFPFTLVDFMLVCGFPPENIVDFRQYALYLHFFMTLFFPFICVLSLSELRSKFTNILHLHGQPRCVAPETLTARAPTNKRINVQ
jgi:hypothetical protein